MNAKGDANRSVRGTKQCLARALTDLLAVKSARDITVRELTGLAGVSRGTFYFHYSDICDLLLQLENELLQTLQTVTDGVLQGLENETPPRALLALFESLRENPALFRALLGPHGDPAFVQRLKDMIEKQCVGHFARRGAESTEQGYLAGFSVAGCLGIVEKWLQSEQAEPPEQAAQLAWRAIRAIGGVAAAL